MYGGGYANNLLTIKVIFRHNGRPESPSIDFTPGVEAWGIRKDFHSRRAGCSAEVGG